MLLLAKYVTFALVFSQISAYTFMNPKLFSQTVPSSSRGWSNIVPYPFRAYQPSIPLQYLGRYYGDPYYPSSIQSPDYYFPHDSYDDADYYSNVLYFLPAGRRNPFFEQTIIDPIEDMPDYEDEPAEEDGISKLQRDWWLEKDVAANEDTDINQFNRVDDLYGKNFKVSQKQKLKNARKNVPKNRYAGIDGFGRKKGQEQIFGNHRSNAKKEERTWVYGVPVHSEYDDRNVKDLKSLLKNPSNKENRIIEDSSLASWASGNTKRSASDVSNSNKKPMSIDKYNLMTTLKPAKPSNTFSVYDEGGQEMVNENFLNENKWKEYDDAETSVFDTIKKLLALEDKVNEVNQEMKSHKLLKRKPPIYKPQMKNKPSQINRSRSQSSTTQTIPTSKNALLVTSTSTPIRNNKRSVSAADKLKSYYLSEDSLARELKALQYRQS